MAKKSKVAPTKKTAARGRPRRYVGDRPNWTIRLDVEVGDRIREMAEATGRSISEICEQQIVRSFELADDLAKARAETKDISIAFMTTQRRMEAAEAELDRMATMQTLIESAVHRAMRRAMLPLRKQQSKNARTRIARGKD
ncbi:ribbon-helix-helix protein, CopG family [Bradyrhizobium sp. 41S5]|uniref:ribbon-helix-helix protein, CopG family n=1 Tax=Bradyrhizobium sp. 41S5 TaxID=1404443 RepID=UPI00156B357E|nr:ribbon-helix-helix protein, CopG family [Bradyrhizobium sp. 41S5]UFX41705.1 ribbon-helix-helix protein, CopG family [Bradyrhizobium sp. 41S5]